MLFVCIIVKCPQSNHVTADVRLLLWQCIQSSYIQFAAHHGPMVALQCSLRLQLITHAYCSCETDASC